jgi:hypothetical protein
VIFDKRYIKTVNLIFFLRMIYIISCADIFEIRINKLACLSKILDIFVGLRFQSIINILHHVSKRLRCYASFSHQLLINISLVLWSFCSYFYLLFYFTCFYWQIICVYLFSLIWRLYWALEICLLQFCCLIKTFGSLV